MKFSDEYEDWQKCTNDYEESESKQIDKLQTTPLKVGDIVELGVDGTTVKKITSTGKPFGIVTEGELWWKKNPLEWKASEFVKIVQFGKLLFPTTKLGITGSPNLALTFNGTEWKEATPTTVGSSKTKDAAMASLYQESIYAILEEDMGQGWKAYINFLNT